MDLVNNNKFPKLVNSHLNLIIGMRKAQSLSIMKRIGNLLIQVSLSPDYVNWGGLFLDWTPIWNLNPKPNAILYE